LTVKRTGWQTVAIAAAGWVLFSSAPGGAVDFTLYPYAEIAGVYNDNIGQQSTGNGSGRGDFIATELLSGSLEADASQKHFSLDYSTVESQYVSTPSLDRTFQDHYVGTTYDQRISPTTTFSVTNSLLVGNAVSSTIITGNQIPIGSQLLQGLLVRNSSCDNLFNADLTYTEPQSWSLGAAVHQLFFSGGGGAAGESFGQGVALNADRPIGGNFRAGPGYSFDDFRFGGEFPPAESHWPQVRLIWQPDLSYYVLIRTGPILMDNFAGVSNGVYQSGGWSVSPGGMVLARLSEPRFSVQLEGGQQPGLGVGLAGAALNRSASLLLEYLASRSLSVFVKQGFLEVSAQDSDAKLITYSIGATYRMSRNVFLTAEYYGICNIFNGTSAQIVGVESGTQTVSNMFLVGVMWEPAPIYWRW